MSIWALGTQTVIKCGETYVQYMNTVFCSMLLVEFVIAYCVRKGNLKKAVLFFLIFTVCAWIGQSSNFHNQEVWNVYVIPNAFTFESRYNWIKILQEEQITLHCNCVHSDIILICFQVTVCLLHTVMLVQYNMNCKLTCQKFRN